MLHLLDACDYERVTEKRPRLTCEQKQELQRLLRTVVRARELKRVQCVLLAGTTDWPLSRIGEVVGLRAESVRHLLYQHQQQGVAALVPGDHGHPRPHARLTLFQEEQWLRVLRDDADRGLHVTASHAYDRLRDLYGESVVKDVVYDVFSRHGWRPDPDWREPAGGGRAEGRYLPPTEQAKGNRRTVPSRYQAKRPVRDLHRERGSESRHLLSAETERQLVGALRRRTDAGTPVPLADACKLAAELTGRSVSSNTAARMLRRNGWRPLKHGSYTTWVPGDCENPEALLQQRLWGDPRTLLAEEDDRLIQRGLSRLAADQHPVAFRSVSALFTSVTGRTHDRHFVRGWLLRKGWRCVRRGPDSHWARPSSSQAAI